TWHAAPCRPCRSAFRPTCRAEGRPTMTNQAGFSWNFSVYFRVLPWPFTNPEGYRLGGHCRPGYSGGSTYHRGGREPVHPAAEGATRPETLRQKNCRGGGCTSHVGSGERPAPRWPTEGERPRVLRLRLHSQVTGQRGDGLTKAV